MTHDQRSTPWPRYPCCPCRRDPERGRHIVQLCWCMRDLYGTDERGATWVPYEEASSYSWHTACWNRITGLWRAVCCLGHVVEGKALAA